MSTETTTAVTTTEAPSGGLDLFDAGQFGRAVELAKQLSTASGFVPRHLLGNPGACLGVVSLAAAWRVNPFLLATASSDIHGKLLWEAKAIQAGIERSGAIHGRLSFRFIGDWGKIRGKFTMRESARKDENGRAGMYAVPAWNPSDEEGLAVEVSGTPAGSSEPIVTTTYLKACHPRNSTLWATDPETQCRYRATRNWGRLAVPGVMLGAVAVDEFEPPQEINITAAGSDAPAKPTAGARLAAKMAEAKAETKPEPKPEPAPAEPSQAESAPHDHEPARIPYKLASALAATAAAGIERTDLLLWLIARGTLTDGQKLDDMPQNVIDYLAEHPDKAAGAIKAWKAQPF